MEVTIDLPRDVYLGFSRLARKTRSPVEDVIRSRLDIDFSDDNAGYEEKVANWSDSAVLALSKLQMPEDQAARMGALSDRLDRGVITEVEERELEVYTELYQMATLRKAYGMSEAFKRGLIKSPNDLR